MICNVQKEIDNLLMSKAEGSKIQSRAKLLDNAWVFRKVGQQPEATTSPSLGDLFETRTTDPTRSEKGSEVPEECMSGTGDGRYTGKGGRSIGKGSWSTRRGGGSAGTGRGSRPGRVRRAPDRLGEWARV